MNDYNKTILLVEDEPVISLIETSILKKSGYTVHAVSSGEKAIELVQSGEHIDLILMDIDLGRKMDGTEAAERILGIRDIPIIFLSSHTEPDIVDKTEGITSYGYVVKNSGDTVLLASIKMAFRLYNERMKVQRHREEYEEVNKQLTAAFEELEATNEDLIESQSEISKSEERYRRLFASSIDGICVHEVVYCGDQACDYRILDVNRSYENIIGLHRSDVTGKLASEVYGTGTPPYLDVYASVAESEKSVTFNTYFEPMDSHFHISVFSPGKGMFATVFQDITERVRSETILRESEEKFRNIFQNAPLGLVHYDSKGIITECNTIFTEIIGSTHEQLAGLDMLSLRDRKLVEALECALEGSTGYYEGDYHSVTGNKVTPVRVWFTPLFSPEKTVAGGICIAQDVSEQSKALMRIADRERQFRTLFETLTQGVVYYDSTGTIIDANPAAETILGLKRDQIVGRTSFHPEWNTLREDFSDFPAEEHPSMIALKTGNPVRGIIMGVYNSMEKHHRWLSVDAMPEFSGGADKPFRAYAAFTDITLRRQAETILRDSEERYRALAEVSPNSILIHQNGKIVYINDTGLKLFGVSSRDDLVGTDFLDRVHPDSVELVSERIRLVLDRSQRVPTIELLMSRINGEMFFAESMAGPIMHNGAPAVQVILHDITERKRFEIAADEQKKFLDTLLNAIPAPVFFKDRNGKYIGCNNAFEEFIGFTREEISGKSVFELFTEELSKTYHEADMAVMESGGFQVYEGDVKHSDGSLRRVIFHKAVFYTSDGSVSGLVGVMLDITERKKFEEAIKTSEERFRSLFENSEIAYQSLDKDGKYSDCNDELCRMTGYSREELAGRRFSDIWPESKRSLFIEKFNGFKDKGSVSAEIQILHRNGSLITVLLLGKIQYDIRGEFLRSHCILINISDRVMMEYELRMMKEKLEISVKEKESLLREIQHRVKNNLAMIVGLIGLESSRSHGDETVRILASLRNRIGALEKLYSSLYQTGNVKEIRLDRYISEIVQSLINTYVSGIHNIHIETLLDELTIPIRNAGSIGLIINELVINTLKYAFPDGRDGGITIGLSSAESGYEIYVRDNGAGLPPGFDIDNTAGSGIMIIKMMAEHMGGEFTFSSDAVTEFRLKIPYGE